MEGYAASRDALWSSAILSRSASAAGRRVSSVGATDRLQGPGQVIGVVRLVLDVLPRVGVLEAELHRVQPLPPQPEPAGEGRVGAVGEVADARVLERRHVRPDLVGAAG